MNSRKLFHSRHRFNKLLQRRKKSSSSLFISGNGWTGSFGTGPQNMTSSETSDVSPEERDNSFTNIHHDVDEMGKIVDAAAGWGHTVLLCKKDNNNETTTKMYVAGRPYDFQALLRLYRLPSFIRRAAVTLSLNLDEEKDLGFASNMFEKYMKRDGNGDGNGNGNGNDESFPSYRKTVLPFFKEVKLPDGDIPLFNSDYNNKHRTLAASAGLTAVIGQSGKAYTFGLNRNGQCGVGKRDKIHVWDPTPVDIMGSSGDGESTVIDVALGLQHGLVLDKNGSIHAFGKGSRGQLGTAKDERLEHIDNDEEKTKSVLKVDYEHSPIEVGHFEIGEEKSGGNSLSENDTRATRISAGWNHSAAVTKSNHAWIWGKNVVIGPAESGTRLSAADSIQPVHVKGLPEHLTIIDISCGSHHTSILMEDGSVYATGISTDTNEPVGGDTAVQVIPPGLIDLPIRQFKSHFDRTTIVAGENGNQILEVQLWSTEQLRQEAVFEPAWVETILGSSNGITSINRGWLHTVVVRHDT